jgi:hypothetical protein
VAEESWHQARLIPTSGINGAMEQERRATSALLAVMSAVREFGRVLTQPLGAPVGPVETYIEVPFELNSKTSIPDGLIRVCRAQKCWTALVEVKTGANELLAEQLENYLDIARRESFDAVITISNEVPAIAGQHPTRVDRRKVSRVALHHYSWSEILSEAVMQKEHRGVADPDQAWILGELIRYMEHPRSGVLEFQDMGTYWVDVRNAITAGTLRPSDGGVSEVAGRLDALLRYSGLLLGRQLGTEVVPVLPRREVADPALRNQQVVNALTTGGVFDGSIRVPNTVGLLNISIDLRANIITCHVDVDAPREGRPTTRVNWLLRQLQRAPETVRIESFAMHARGASAAELLREARVDPTRLIADPKKELRTFRVALSCKLGSKRGGDRGSFIKSVLDAVDRFYADILQELKAWTPAPPRMRDLAEESKLQPASLSSTALSSQDGVEPTDDDSAESVPASPAATTLTDIANRAPVSKAYVDEPALEGPHSPVPASLTADDVVNVSKPDSPERWHMPQTPTPAAATTTTLASTPVAGARYRDADLSTEE